MNISVIIIIVFVLAIFLLILTFLFINNIVEYAIGKVGNGGNRNDAKNESDYFVSHYRDVMGYKVKERNETKEFLSNHLEQKIIVKTYDNIKLAGFCFLNKDSHKWVILIHGYRQDHKAFYEPARHYYEKGYNVLLPDLRAGGESEGKYIGMGYLESKDMSYFVDYILSVDSEAHIVIHGYSMGATTLMLYAGTDVDKHVKCFIEDSGYTNALDIFKLEIKKRFNLKPFPILNMADFMAKIKAGYRFSDATCVDALKRCEKPILLIHGRADDFVPFEMLKTLYDAVKTDEKEKIEVEGAGHVESRYIMGEEYYNKVFSFINEAK